MENRVVYDGHRLWRLSFRLWFYPIGGYQTCSMSWTDLKKNIVFIFHASPSNKVRVSAWVCCVRNIIRIKDQFCFGINFQILFIVWCCQHLWAVLLLLLSEWPCRCFENLHKTCNWICKVLQCICSSPCHRLSRSSRSFFFPPLRHFTQNNHTDCDLYKRKARDPKMKRKRKRDGASESELKVIDWKNRFRGATTEDIREESCSPALFPLASFCCFLLVWRPLSFLSSSLFSCLFHTSFLFFVS